MSSSPKFLVPALFLSALALTSIAALAFSQTPPPRPGNEAGAPPRPGDRPPPRDRGRSDVNETKIVSTGKNDVIGEVWVDNWFKLYLNGQPLLEDSVPITTERSFNAERFSFKADLPMTLAFEFRDFMEDETGLEYIGTRRQQLGDGGAIAQFKDLGSGKLLSASGADWRCLVVHSAPADASCAREQAPSVEKANCAPSQTSVSDTWMLPEFDDSTWPAATIHSASDVGPKDGYDRIDWDASASLIWGPDLKRNNILFCRTTVGG